MEQSTKQVLVILQGPPGGGKSKLAETLWKGIGNAVIHCTDDYFTDNAGVYHFDPTKLGEFHQRNQFRACEALEDGYSVIVPNTNIRCFECKPYVSHAVFLGISVIFIRVDGGFQNTHGVSPEVVDRMRQQMETLTVDKVLKSLAPWETPAESYEI